MLWPVFPQFRPSAPLSSGVGLIITFERTCILNSDQYKALFDEPEPQRSKDGPKEVDTRAGRALAYALDIRKFEIELYWKRATYFWAFIAAAFAAYALTFKTSSEHEPWLSILFSSLGLVFSFAWYLVNRGSKFWQNNWERHVDLLENITLGPLYKIIAVDTSTGNPLTSAGQFSVSKINQILSVFVTLIWILLFTKSILPISIDLPPDCYKITVLIFTIGSIWVLYKLGRSSNKVTKSTLSERKVEIETI